MDSPEISTEIVCSKHGDNLNKEKCLDPNMDQREHISGPKDITQNKRPNIDVSTCGIQSKTLDSGVSSCLEPIQQKVVYTGKYKTSFPHSGKRYLKPGVTTLSEELKVKKTGKYVCNYCGRACAKPSVLKKHIRSHTGERPYPCIPCGFSFKTKSNLYKHRKSHAHAVKTQLLPFSVHGRKHIVSSEVLTAGEGEMHSDNEQSTDTDEEVTEDLAFDRGISFHMKDIEDSEQEECGILAQNIPGITLTPSSSKNVSLSGKVSLWQFREMMAPAFVSQTDQEAKSSTVKQKLALRLSEKRNQELDLSLPLPSSYSKGSTDSGYFSRSESTEQQFFQPTTSVKSYQEIMFGKCYRPSTKPRQSITVQTCMTDTNDATSSFMIKLSKGSISGKGTSYLQRHKKDLIKSIKMESESFQEEDFQERPEIVQCNTGLLETPSESSSLLRSNSLPTSSDSNLSTSQVLRSSSSFDERMTNEDVSFRSSVGMRKLMRQTAFEHSALEGHTESESQTLVCGLKSELKLNSVDESKLGMENCQESEPCLMLQSHMMENATRKRRKGKSTTEDEENFPAQNKPLSLLEASGDLYTKHAEDASYTDTERRFGSNVISVIQHTKSLSRPSSVEKAIVFESQQFNKSSLYQLLEKGQIKEEFKSDWSGSNMLYQRCHLTKQLGVQSGLQVPEIRVTEEPDKPEKVPDVQLRTNEKPKEEFQWPQRSETLSNFPVEKLPPKKKRLRLAELECSSGESSFESACTSLSRSPSQDSNLSPSSSFSQSLDKEENVNFVTSAKSEEYNKPLEFLSVPLSSLGNQQREMRRSTSEQAPYNLPMELPEFRSKSFDYSNLSSSPSFIQEGVYASVCGFKERRRGFLVRQASLSGEPEIVTCDKPSDTNSLHSNTDSTSSSKQHLLEGCSDVEKMGYSLIYGNVSPQQLISSDLSWMPEQISSKRHPYPLLPHILQVNQYHSIKSKIKKEPQDYKSAEAISTVLAEVTKEYPQNISSALSSTAVLSHAHPAFANQGMCGLRVPVRIQMQVPCYGKITYTSISHVLDSQYTTNLAKCQFLTQSQSSRGTLQSMVNFDLPQASGQSSTSSHNPHCYPARLQTGIPLSLTSRTISTTVAPSGASKRMLSPASSIELFIDETQQKRVKDEKMYGQIVDELSAVELGHPEFGQETVKKEIKATHIQETSVMSDEIYMDDLNCNYYNKTELSQPCGVHQKDVLLNTLPMQVSTSQDSGIATVALPRDIGNFWILSQFPGLHTTTCVSWCYLNSSKPNSTETVSRFSVYASWIVKCYNPNPPNLSTGMTLALLRSKQNRQNATYTTGTLYQPGMLVTSALPSQKQEEGTRENRMGDTFFDTRTKDIKPKSRSMRENSKESDASLRQTEPMRIKIFEGGYKSNEEYVYVRGRGRGKYICEECGIRCKKPSMLKKHIRTHTDVRPYVCKCCNFAFKTKGNLTKHMKSKAHLKKCLEIGVSPMDMDTTDIADHDEDVQKHSDTRLVTDTGIKHQFSDADDSDGGEDDGDEPDDEEEDEYDGDSTPRTLSRSTSPQSCTINKPLPSISLTKSLDRVSSPRERAEASTLINEDEFTLEQASTSFDLCTSQLLSPCWDSPHQRFVCLKGDLSSRRTTSLLRPISPKKDLNIRGDISNIRQLTSVRPISPVSDLYRHRTPSPRGQQRGMLRAASQRGTYLYKSYSDQSRGIRHDGSLLTSEKLPEMDQNEAIIRNTVSDRVCSSNDTSIPVHRDIFSHLPLHSQWQVPTPIPMVPIGGLRMPFVSPSGAVVERHSQSMPQGSISDRANSSQASVPILGIEVSNPSSHRKEIPTSSTGLASKNKKQEEIVQICAEAIASLRITSEDIVDHSSES